MLVMAMLVAVESSALAAADAATPAELRGAGIRTCAPLQPDDPARYAFYARGAVASLASADRAAALPPTI